MDDPRIEEQDDLNRREICHCGHRAEEHGSEVVYGYPGCLRFGCTCLEFTEEDN